MNRYSTPICPNRKCKSIDVFRAFNKNTRCDDGVCRDCFHKSDFDDFIAAGEAFDAPEKAFDKDYYYEMKATF